MDIKNLKEKTQKIKWISKMIFVTSIKQNTTENEQKIIQKRIRREWNYEQKFIKKNLKRMKLYNKKIIMKINII